MGRIVRRWLPSLGLIGTSGASIKLVRVTDACRAQSSAVQSLRRSLSSVSAISLRVRTLRESHAEVSLLATERISSNSLIVRLCNDRRYFPVSVCSISMSMAEFVDVIANV